MNGTIYYLWLHLLFMVPLVTNGTICEALTPVEVPTEVAGVNHHQVLYNAYIPGLHFLFFLAWNVGGSPQLVRRRVE